MEEIKKTRDSFIFYRSFYEAISGVPQKNQLNIYRAIAEYALNKKEPNFIGIEKTVWVLIKPQLEANYKRFLNGAKPKQKGSETEAKPKQKGSETEANNNVNNNVNNNPNLNSNPNVNPNPPSGDIPSEYETIKEVWNSFAKENGLTAIESLSKKRIANIKARTKEKAFDLEKIFSEIRTSDFLRGKTSANFKASFDWIFGSTTNYLKVLEGNYTNKEDKARKELEQWLKED